MEKEIIKRADYLLFSDTQSILGFLANLGLVTLAYTLVNIIGNVFSLENLSSLNRFNIFSISYLVFLGVSYKWVLRKNEKFNVGFTIAMVFVLLIMASTYLRAFL